MVVWGVMIAILACNVDHSSTMTRCQNCASSIVEMGWNLCRSVMMGTIRMVMGARWIVEWNLGTIVEEVLLTLLIFVLCIRLQRWLWCRLDRLGIRRRLCWMWSWTICLRICCSRLVVMIGVVVFCWRNWWMGIQGLFPSNRLICLVLVIVSPFILSSGDITLGSLGPRWRLVRLSVKNTSKPCQPIKYWRFRYNLRICQKLIHHRRTSFDHIMILLSLYFKNIMFYTE